MDLSISSSTKYRFGQYRLSSPLRSMKRRIEFQSLRVAGSVDLRNRVDKELLHNEFRITQRGENETRPSAQLIRAMQSRAV
jgi:hypothetical protein